jgi:hypothetical protein
MNLIAAKENIIHWIEEIDNENIIKEIQKLKIKYTSNKRDLFGCAKGKIEYMADDFDAPMDEFQN